MSEQGGVTLTKDIAPFWLKFPGFDPDRTASFERDFSRLAEREGWSTQIKHKQLAAAVASELALENNNDVGLEHWKMFCREVGITDELASITQCRKVRNSHLRPRQGSLCFMAKH